jgi:hypothetical protein
MTKLICALTWTAHPSGWALMQILRRMMGLMIMVRPFLLEVVLYNLGII